MIFKKYTNLIFFGIPASFLWYHFDVSSKHMSLVNQVENSVNEVIEDHEALPNQDFIEDDFSETAVQGLPIQRVEQIDSIGLSSSDTEIIKTTQSKFKPLKKKFFYTPKERQEFFTGLGIDYLNGTEIECLSVFEANPRELDQYLKDVEGNEYMIQQYSKDIAEHRLVPMSIRWLGSEIGHGIFAEADIPVGGFIGIYGGVVRDRSLVLDRDFAWSYPGLTLEGGRITLDAAQRGNELRFINDGKDPNCFMKYIIGDDNLWHVCYLAAKDIKKGEQLLISYGASYWDTRQYKYKELAQ